MTKTKVQAAASSLADHASFFDRLVALIPPKFYYDTGADQVSVKFLKKDTRAQVPTYTSLTPLPLTAALACLAKSAILIVQQTCLTARSMPAGEGGIQTAVEGGQEAAFGP